MLQFPVPQFIDIEDKLIGPLSLKQFGFILPGALLVFLLFRIFKLGPAFFFTALPVVIATLAVGFGQFNGKPLYNQFGTFIKFISTPKRYQFSKQQDSTDNLNLGAIDIQRTSDEINPLQKEIVETPQSKLHRLSMMLDQKTQEEEDIVNPEER